MKRYLAPVVLLLTSALTPPAPAAPQSDTRAIIPGGIIGKVIIGRPLEDLPLGPPTFGEGAAGTTWSTWNAEKPEVDTGVIHTVDVLSHLGKTGPQVALVRVTSPYFRTANGLSTGSTLDAIRKAFPHVQRVGQYSPRQVPISVALYDDSARGIAFEILCDAKGATTPTSRCLAISVHAPSKPLRDEPLVHYLESKAATEATNATGKK